MEEQKEQEVRWNGGFGEDDCLVSLMGGDLQSETSNQSFDKLICYYVDRL